MSNGESSAGGGWIASTLSAIRHLPLWVMVGLAMAAWSLLYLPGSGGVDLAPLRKEWGVWIWVAATSFSFLTATRVIDIAANAYALHRRNTEARKALKLVPLSDRQCWWHLAEQQDGSFCSQIRLDVAITNRTDQPVKVVSVSLIRPQHKGDIVHADLSLPRGGFYSPNNPVAALGTTVAALHLMVRGKLTKQGKPLRATFEVTDQFGEVYVVKDVTIRAHDKPVPKPPLRERLVASLGTSEREPEEKPVPTQWNHGGEFGEVDRILNEEKRFYAANGRIRGGLGSMNVGLQSEPNLGWTTVGEVPSLLWVRGGAPTVASPNIDRLLKLQGSLDQVQQLAIEAYLLSHVDRRSRYADVAYAIFLALHRMGRSVEALRAARDFLAGDKVYGYSNVLGILAAIVSREHFAITADTLQGMLDTIAGGTEYDFKLDEKINLALLQKLDEKLASSSASDKEEPKDIA